MAQSTSKDIRQLRITEIVLLLMKIDHVLAIMTIVNIRSHIYITSY